MKIPEVRIYFSSLLHENVSVHLDKQLNDGSWTMDSDEETLREYAANYQKEWDKYHKKIVTALVEATGLEFYQDVIDVPCAHYFRAQSSPLMMSFYYYPDQFVDVFIHELIHVLLTDNKTISLKDHNCTTELDKRWQKLFGRHDFTTLVHIPVHALSKYIYLDVLKEPYRLDRDMKDVKNNAPYVRAWKYVNDNNYRQVVKKIKQDYANLQKELAGK